MNSLGASVTNSVVSKKDLWQATTDGSTAAFLVLEPYFDSQGKISDFVISMANDTASLQTGIPVNRLVGSKINVLFPVNLSDGHFYLYRDALLNGQPFERKYRVPEGNHGSGIWVQKVVPVHGRIVIRNRPYVPSEAEQGLELDMAKDRANLLERVIREAGHDLRTPMTVITTSLYLAEQYAEKGDNEKMHEYQNQAKAQIKRLNDMLSGLVDVAKMQQRSDDFSIADANSFVESAYRDFSVLAKTHNRLLRISKTDTDCQVLMNEASMYRAYGNLVKNAITYTNEGDLVTLMTNVDEGTNSVHMSVVDTGIGIDKDNLSKIFERYYRVDNTIAKDEGNQGMGLSIAKEIVNTHGGEITVKSEKNTATTFTIILPRIKS